MGAWSGEPFGNDTALDWAFELADSSDWDVVADALTEATNAGIDVDQDVACNAIAAAEVVARGLGHPTQDDDSMEDIAAFVTRAGAPSAELVQLALAGLTAATAPDTELSDLWVESGETEWTEANALIAAALRS